MKAKIIVALLVIALIGLGFIRDHVFVAINAEAGAGLNGSVWKWPLTFLFSILYVLLTCGLSYALFHSRKYIRITVFLYGMIFLISLMLGMAGYLFYSFESIYHFIRAIMGVAQSPVPAIILIPLFLLNEQMAGDKKS
jgi:hypothetical protein